MSDRTPSEPKCCLNSFSNWKEESRNGFFPSFQKMCGKLPNTGKALGPGIGEETESVAICLGRKIFKENMATEIKAIDNRTQTMMSKLNLYHSLFHALLKSN